MFSFSSIRSAVHSVGSASWPPLFFGRGIGHEVRARPPPLDDLVGDAVVVERKCRVGSSNGELRIGFSITATSAAAQQPRGSTVVESHQRDVGR